MAEPQKAVNHPAHVWFDGKLVLWEQATVHVTQVEWSGVSAVFEGIKAYKSGEEDQAYVFRLDDHLSRFDDSMRLMRMQPEWDGGQLTDGLIALLRANEVRSDTYIRPFAFFGAGGSFSKQSGAPTHVLITTMPFEAILKTGKTKTAAVSSWTRISDNVMPPRVKAVANYQNSRLAATEAAMNGYDEAIILNERHKVAEGPGACIMLVKRGRVITPPITAGVLESIALLQKTA